MKNNQIELLWEIPLAFLSFLFYKIMKFVIGNLYTIYLSFQKKKATQWRVLSQETLDSPLSLPVLMTKGPRWNTHAIIGTVGPFPVQEEISLDVKLANNSARSWIAVVYSFPSYKTITTIEPHQVGKDQDWFNLKLPQGKYSLGLRYYNCYDQISLPIVKVDGNKLIDSQPVDPNVNQFYHNLIQAKNWFYSSLHYYIFTILKLRQFLPASFVEREFLPVGAPDTQFFYHYLEPNQKLQIKLEPQILQDYNIYFTLYDRSSLPLSWQQITTEAYESETIKNQGYYLLRIRSQDPQKLVLDHPLSCQLDPKDGLIEYLALKIT
jgi:hypothetical protein